MKFVRPKGLGVCIPLREINHSGEIIQRELDLLAPDWWMNWSYRTYGASNERFMPMVWSDGWGEEPVGEALMELPGRTWLIHNEGNHKDQANLTPKQAAKDVWRLGKLASDLDVEIQMAWGGCGVIDEYIGGGNVDGIQWMRDFVYKMRRSGWTRSSNLHFHGYRFNTIEQMERGWERVQRLQDELSLGPPFISEMCAENSPPANQMLIMDRVRRWIDDGRIIGAAWYSTHESGVVVWPNSRLTDHLEGGEIVLTEIGRHWKMLAAA